MFLLSIFSGQASAGTIIWNISATFADGGALTGWFGFDSNAINDVLDGYSLSVSGGDTSLFPAFTYTPVDSFSGGGFSLAELVVNDESNERELLVNFSSNLTNAGASPSLVVSLSSAEFCCGSADNRDLISGSADSEPSTPEPVTWASTAVGLAALTACVRLRRKSGGLPFSR
jgi:hypothetical protein